MSTLKRPDDAMSKADPSASSAAPGDKLWMFQVRRENLALLQKIQAMEQTAQALPAKVDVRFKDSVDFIEKLAARITALEDDNRVLISERDAWVKEIDGLKEQMAVFHEQVARSTEPQAELQELKRLYHERTNGNGGPSQTHEAVNSTPQVNAATPQPKPTPASKFKTAVNPMVTVTPKLPHLSKDTTPQTRSTPTNNQVTPAHSTPNSSQAVRRPANRKPSSSAPQRTRTTRTRKVSGPYTAVSKPSPPKHMRLSQGPGSISAYHASTNNTYTESSAMNSQGEIDFVGAFIAGIASEKEKGALIAELERLHPFRTKRDGTIELLCQWEDVEEGLVNAGLMAEKVKEGRQKRRTLGDVDFVRG